MAKYQQIFFYLSQCKKKLIIHLQKDLVVKKDPNKSDKFCEIHSMFVIPLWWDVFCVPVFRKQGFSF